MLLVYGKFIVTKLLHPFLLDFASAALPSLSHIKNRELKKSCGGTDILRRIFKTRWEAVYFSVNSATLPVFSYFMGPLWPCGSESGVGFYFGFRWWPSLQTLTNNPAKKTSKALYLWINYSACADHLWIVLNPEHNTLHMYILCGNRVHWFKSKTCFNS